MSLYQRKRKRRLLILGFTFLFVLFFIRKNSFESLGEIFKTLSFHMILILFMLQVFTFYLINLQYRLLFKHIDVDVSYKNLITMNFIGTFYESITPMLKVGGEVFKVGYLSQKGYDIHLCTAVVSIQKTLSFMCFFLLTCISLILYGKTFLFAQQSHRYWIIFLILLSVFIAVFMVLFYLVKTSKKDFLIQLKSTYLKFSKHKINFLIYVCLSLFIWILFAYKTYLILGFLNHPLLFEYAAFSTYITYMIGLIPLTPGAIGIYEGTLSWLLTAMGTPSSIAVVAAITLRFATFWIVFFMSAIYLGFYYMLNKRSLYAIDH